MTESAARKQDDVAVSFQVMNLDEPLTDRAISALASLLLAVLVEEFDEETNVRNLNDDRTHKTIHTKNTLSMR